MKLSIVTICRNDADGLERTLRSTLREQFGFDDFEQIVVDGASTDRTPEVLASFRGDPRLGPVFSEPDDGIYDAMDKGAAAAKGDWLLFLNAGDVLVCGILARVFAEPLPADVVYGDLHNGLDPDAPVRLFPDGASITPLHFLADHLPHPATFVSRALFERLGGYDRRFRIVGDNDFFLRAAAAPGTRFLHLPFPVSRFDAGGVSSSPAQWPRMRKELDDSLAPFFPNPLRRYVLDGMYCRRIEERADPESWAARRSPADECLRPALRARLDADPAARRRALRFLDLFSALDRTRPGRALLGLLATAAERLEARRLHRAARR